MNVDCTWKTLAAVVLVMGAAACSGTDGQAPGAPSATPAEGFDTSKVNTQGCAAAAKLVYVISQERDLYSFSPDTSTFTKIGRLSCATTRPPVSMAIDRQGTAWVNYADGGLYKISTADASCEATTFAPNQQGFLKFGMAFTTNDQTSETLFVSGLVDTSGKGFGKVDLASLSVSMIGEYSNSLAGRAAELTGTGDGRLYGFFMTSPVATLAEIDPSSGATANEKPLSGVSTGNAFAFSFWGGDFWFYTSDGLSPSKVTRLATSRDGSLSVSMPDVGGFRIVGAGTSTCAPLAPPS